MNKETWEFIFQAMQAVGAMILPIGLAIWAWYNDNQHRTQQKRKEELLMLKGHIDTYLMPENIRIMNEIIIPLTNGKNTSKETRDSIVCATHRSLNTYLSLIKETSFSYIAPSIEIFYYFLVYLEIHVDTISNSPAVQSKLLVSVHNYISYLSSYLLQDRSKYEKSINRHLPELFNSNFLKNFIEIFAEFDNFDNINELYEYLKEQRTKELTHE